MYQLYYYIEGAGKTTEEYSSMAELMFRLEELKPQLQTCDSFLAQIVGPDGTLIQEASR